MKKTFTLMLSTLALMASPAFVSAQQNTPEPDHLHCGTDQAVQEVFSRNPQLKAEWEQENARLEELDREASKNNYAAARSGPGPNSATTTPPTFIIPIVFHILHEYGSENISDAQILDEVRILNEDYRKLNADTSSIVSQFTGIAADASIEFRLANIDPNGNCTNGIDRIYSTLTNAADDNSKLNYWTRSKYLNVWVVKSIGTAGVAGYAYLPGTAPSASADGILILSSYIGSIGTGSLSTSRALTHEIGHFLNLQHVWGSSNNPGVACGNDGVSDTPITKGWTSCNLTSNAICNANIVENVQNYMEYSYCSRMFTLGQKTRMHNALGSSTGQRSSLVSAATATATGINNDPPVTCAPKADFSPYETIFVCEGGTVNFTDISWNGAPTAWSWTFQGGTPSTSSQQNPTITYNTAGSYSVSLTASNSAGSNTKSRTGIVRVMTATPQYSNTFTEGFENATSVSNDWLVLNPSGNNQWTRITTASYTGSASMKVNNTTNSSGEVEELISPSIDMSTMNGNTTMTFRLSFAQKATSNTDKLRVLVSTNCGETWTQRYTKAGSNLGTVATQTAAYTPSQASDWRLETVNLSAFASATNLRIKFEFTNGGGNNIYIEDININSSVGLYELNEELLGLSIFPNPASNNTSISFSLPEKQQVKLELLDMLGQSVMLINNSTLNSGDHRFEIATEGTLPSGIYIVRLFIGGQSVTRKLVVE